MFRRTIVAIAASTALFAATPAFAFNWLCIATDKAKVEYEGRSFGLSNEWVKNRAGEKALAKCSSSGGQACAIKQCIDLDAQYQKGTPLVPF